jgi:Arc/MetJ-type ribon-helix-helix transcriptional regulator
MFLTFMGFERDQPMSVERSLLLPDEMHNRLQQLLSKQGREVSESDLIREAIRYYLDNQEEMLASRRHFTKTFQDRIDRLELALTFHLNILLHLVAAGFSLLLAAVARQKIPAQTLIQNAVITARKDTTLTAQIAAVRDMPGPEEAQ